MIMLQKRLRVTLGVLASIGLPCVFAAPALAQAPTLTIGSLTITQHEPTAADNIAFPITIQNNPGPGGCSFAVIVSWTDYDVSWNVVGSGTQSPGGFNGPPVQPNFFTANLNTNCDFMGGLVRGGGWPVGTKHVRYVYSITGGAGGPDTIHGGSWSATGNVSTQTGYEQIDL
jgi:hypothetical protein